MKSDKAESKNLTFNPKVLELAEAVMAVRSFDNLSGFISQLIREEYERRHGPATIQNPNPAQPLQPQPGAGQIGKRRSMGKRRKSKTYGEG